MREMMPIAGVYFTDFGQLRLEVDGDRVEGTYTFQQGSVSGILNGDRVEGTWVQQGNQRGGSFVFEFDPGANGFRGSFRYSDPNAGGGRWNGTRLELPPEDAGGFPGGWHCDPSGPLLAGPMIGEVGEREAYIWVQARSASPLALIIERHSGRERRIVETPAYREWLCHTFHVTDLQPGVAYTYFFESQHGRTPTRPLMLAPQSGERAVRIAFGSCFRFTWENELPIFDAIAQDEPACLAMIGDNTYYYEPDWQTEHTMMMAQLRARNNDSFRRVVEHLPTLGIWDDHDFGPNDADNTFRGKEMALRAFTRMWANARFGTESQTGVFSAVRMGPAEIFLLDSRTYRNKEARTLLGDAQLSWLIDSLEKSVAPVKIIASPTQVLADAAIRRRWECFGADAPEELDRLLHEIAARNIQGVVFISGDLHMANLFHREGQSLRKGRGPELWEMTVSPLANEPWKESIEGDDAYLVAEVIDRCNYGLVDIDLDRTGAEILLQCKDEKGEVLFEQEISLEELSLRE